MRTCFMFVENFDEAAWIVFENQRRKGTNQATREDKMTDFNAETNKMALHAKKTPVFEKTW